MSLGTSPPQDINTSSDITLSTKQFEQLRTIVYDRSGIGIDPSKQATVETRLAGRLAELTLENYDEYITFLSIGPHRDDEFQELLSRVITSKTSFFRGAAQLQVFENTAMPELINARQESKRLRIWSAGCSTGEEPHTLAMQVDRALGVRLSDWRIEIMGTDLSDRALDIACEGVYSDESIGSMPKPLLEKHFTTIGGAHHLKDHIREMVVVDRHDLRDALAARRYGKWDVIFCRSVMPGFDDEMQQRVVDLFADQLAEDGWLFIGDSESIQCADTPFHPQPYPNGFCYRKLSGTEG